MLPKAPLVKITVRLPPEIAERLRDAAVFERMTLPAVVTAAIKAFLKGKRIPKRTRPVRKGPPVR